MKEIIPFVITAKENTMSYSKHGSRATGIVLYNLAVGLIALAVSLRCGDAFGPLLVLGVGIGLEAGVTLLVAVVEG